MTLKIGISDSFCKKKKKRSHIELKLILEVKFINHSFHILSAVCNKSYYDPFIFINCKTIKIIDNVH